MDRRKLVFSTPVAALIGHQLARQALAQSATPADELDSSLTIDLSGGPDNLDPALTRSFRDWSILHSIYDSILDLSESGEVRPLAASSFATNDNLTWEVVLREGLTFHDGTPVTSESIARSISWVQQSEGPAAGNFAVIERVDIVDDITARIVTAEPAPWLPSQLAVWLVLFPEGMTTEEFQTNPVGSGPYRFVSQEAGAQIILERNPDYPADSPKGTPIAQQVIYRFVPEVTTRVADIATGSAQIVDGLGLEHRAAVEDAGATAVESPVLGTSFLRLVNDVSPFDQPLVRQAINHAIDVESIGQALVSEQVHRLASIYPDERSIGFDSALSPFAYDPELARDLLAQAGVPDGFATTLQYTGGGRADVTEAIAANLAEVGIDLSIEVLDLATFNGSWRAEDSAPLRFVSWRPVYDPHTLLSLMFLSTGPLSRFGDQAADDLITAGAVEADPDARQAIYQELGRYFQESPPAVFLWNLTSIYGVRDQGTLWTPRADEYILPMRRS